MENMFEEYRKMFKEMFEKMSEEMPMPPFPPFGMPMMPFPMMPSPMMSFMEKMKESFEGKENEAKFMNMPKGMLKKLLNIDAAPEDLEKLQKVIDFIFDMYEKKQ